MRHVSAILLCCTVCACGAPRPAIVRDRAPPQTVGLCQLVDASNHYDGKRVVVEALVQLHAHGHFLSDSRCPEAFVSLPSLAAARGYPCRQEALSIAYGCPLRPARARLDGVYRAANSNFIVNEISDIRISDQQ
jgi:hypothetical protein